MKFLIVLVVLLAGVWLWRRGRRERDDSEAPVTPPRPASPPPTPATMVACGHCGMHLPTAEAVAGAKGRYCGADHRRLAEGDAPR